MHTAPAEIHILFAAAGEDVWLFEATIGKRTYALPTHDCLPKSKEVDRPRLWRHPPLCCRDSLPELGCRSPGSWI